MEPLKPEQRRAALGANTAADAADLQEYEKLLSQRFTVDPDEPRTRSRAAVPAPQADVEARLRELHQKLFGGKP